jgi:hypothetical protein
VLTISSVFIRGCHKVFVNRDQLLANPTMVDTSTMRTTRSLAKKQGLGFRNEGTLYSQLNAIECSARNGQDLFTQLEEESEEESEEAEELTEEEEFAVTQRTPELPPPHVLSQIQQRRLATDTATVTLRFNIDEEENESNEDDDEVQVQGIRKCQPLVPHRNLVAQVKFENAETPRSYLYGRYQTNANASTNNNNVSSYMIHDRSRVIFDLLWHPPPRAPKVSFLLLKPTRMLRPTTTIFLLMIHDRPQIVFDLLWHPPPRAPKVSFLLLKKTSFFLEMLSLLCGHSKLFLKLHQPHHSRRQKLILILTKKDWNDLRMLCVEQV